MDFILEIIKDIMKIVTMSILGIWITFLCLGILVGLFRDLPDRKCIRYQGEYLIAPTIIPFCKFRQWASEEIE